MPLTYLRCRSRCRSCSASMERTLSFAPAFASLCWLLMGFGFPTGMRLVSTINARPMPWFWGINGGAGVPVFSLRAL